MKALTYTIFGYLFLAGFTSAAPVEPTAEGLLPKTTVMCAELSQTAELLATLLESPARQQVEGLEFYRNYIESDGYKKLRFVVKLFEIKTGLEWRPALETLTAGGVWVGLDAASEGGVAILAKSADEQTLGKVVRAFVEVARDDAKSKGKEPMVATLYRGVEVYRVDKGGFAQVGPWLIAANNRELGKALLNNLLDGPEQSLARHERFQAARQTYDQQGGWGWADLKALRGAGVAKKLFSGQADNALGEILIGGILEALKEAPYATAAVSLKDPNRIGLKLSAPHVNGSPEREFFFGAEGRGAAEKPLNVPGTVLALSAYRDLGAMWLAADELFDEAVAAKLAQQDSNLGIFFNGKNFGSDVLGQLLPQLQLLLVEQKYAVGTEPAVKLPAAALIARVKDQGALQRQLRAAFQTVVSFINLSGTQAGRPMMEMKTEERAGASLVSGSYVEEEPAKAEGGIHYNFSPALLQREDWFVLCSTRQLAEQLADGLAESLPSAGVNSQVKLNADVLERVLTSNRTTFIAQQQLKKGLDETEAARQVDALLSLVNLLKDAQLTLAGEGDALGLDLELRFAESLVGRE